jgi:hypothetical protein
MTATVFVINGHVIPSSSIEFVSNIFEEITGRGALAQRRYCFYLILKSGFRFTWESEWAEGGEPEPGNIYMQIAEEERLKIICKAWPDSSTTTIRMTPKL